MSYNGKRVNLNVNRHDVCDILRATTALFVDFEMEANNADVSEDRRKIAASSAQYWRELHDKIKKQLDEFDEKNGMK